MSKRERKKAEEKDRKEAELAAVRALQRASDDEKATNETAAAEKRRLVCSLGMQKTLARLSACLSALAPDGLDVGDPCAERVLWTGGPGCATAAYV